MTADQFRRLALGFPETIESAHMNHPDFRVKGKIFATLDSNEKRGMVKLTPEQQAQFVGSAPEVFEPCAGAWGERGCTHVKLRAAKKATVLPALFAAWRKTAPKLLAQQLEIEEEA